MKNILSVLIVSLLLVGCSENRVLIDDLTNKGTEDSPIMYIKEELFNGIGFDIYSDGQLKLETNFKNGVFDGPHKVWYEDGELQCKGNYKEGKKDGLWKEKAENCKIEENYIDGKLEASRTFYFNGQLRSKANYIDGKVIHYHENGQLSMESNYNDESRETTRKEWYENGQLRCEGNYNYDSLMEGFWKFYYPNGQLMSEGNYLDDEPILIKYWDEDGNEVSFEELYYDEDYD